MSAHTVQTGTEQSSKPAPARPGTGHLLRVLGVGFGIAIALGNSIGAGIMRTPSQNAALLPSSVLIMLAWGLGAVYALLGAWSLSELGAMMPSSGGYYTIAKRAFGDYVAFVMGWTDWLGQCGSAAAVAILAGEYAGNILPQWVSRSVLSGAIAILLIALLQWRGIRWGSRFQNTTSGITALVFLTLIAAAFLLRQHAPANTAAPAAVPSGLPLFVACLLVLQAVIYTFDGWYGAIYFGEEIRNPGREIPRSLINGVLLLSAIYLLINAALLVLLPPAMLAKQNLPIATVGSMLFGHAGDTVVRLLMLVSLVSLANAALLNGTRIGYAMSRDGWGSRQFTVVNPGGTPAAALFLTAGATIAFVLSGSFQHVISVTAFTFVAKYALSYIAVFVLRRREPDAPRPYRAWGYPWTTAAATIGSFVFMLAAVVGDSRNTLYSCLLLVVSYPIYVWVQRRRTAAALER